MFYRIIDQELKDYADYKYLEECQETDIITQEQLDKDNRQVIVEEYQEEIPQEEGEPIILTKYRLALNPDYPTIALETAKAAKYEEANTKAFAYLESGNAVYTFEEGKSIEATDGNIAKLGLALVNFILQQDYTSTIEWNTKENENVELNAEALQGIVAGLQAIQAGVWTVKFPAYNTAITEATTVEEVEAIEIDYERQD